MSTPHNPFPVSPESSFRSPTEIGVVERFGMAGIRRSMRDIEPGNSTIGSGIDSFEFTVRGDPQAQDRTISTVQRRRGATFLLTTITTHEDDSFGWLLTAVQLQTPRTHGRSNSHGILVEGFDTPLHMPVPSSRLEYDGSRASKFNTLSVFNIWRVVRQVKQAQA